MKRQRSRVNVLAAIGIASLAFTAIAAAATCEKCLVEIPEGRTRCAACKARAAALKVAQMDEETLVRTAAQSRTSYEAVLEKLLQYYVGIGEASKIERVSEELKLLRRVPRHQYVVFADMLGELKPSKCIEEATQLFNEARSHQERFAIMGQKRDLLLEALDRYRELLVRYPTSDKVAAAAFQMGEIYGSRAIRDYRRAVRCYEKCYEWSPNTILPARLKAGRLYERKLHLPGKAVEAYELVMEHQISPEYRATASWRLKQLQKGEKEE